MLKINSPIVSANWLYRHMNDPNIVVLDATIPKAGTKESSSPSDNIGISNARFFDLKHKFSDTSNPLPSTMPKPSQFEYEAQQLGINQSSFIVIYDRHGIYSSARAWWMFKSMGHEYVAVLDGGYPAWKNENLPCEKLKPFNGKTGNFVANFKSKHFCNALALIDNLKTQKHLVLDARSKARFLGTTAEPRAELRSGHIPQSKSMAYMNLQNDGFMKPKEELVHLFETQNLNNKPLIISCGSGVTACVVALAAHICDIQSVTVYDGSWSEWGANPEFPIEQ